MRKVIWVGVVAAGLAGCHRQVIVASPTPQPGASQPTAAPVSNQTGAADPAGAVKAFLAAARAQDLQALATVWGTPQGPARDVIPRDELEKREIFLLRCLAHDSYQMISDAPAPDGRRVYAVELKRRDLTRTSNFYSVLGPAGRWYVEKFDVEPLQDFCSGG